MTSTAASLLGVTLVLAVLVGFLVVAIVRLRRATRAEGTRTRVSEEAFMAATIQQVLAEKNRAQAATQWVPPPQAVFASSSSLDADIIEHLPIALVVLDMQGLVLRLNAAARTLLGVKIVPARGASVQEAFAAQPTVAQVLSAARPGVQSVARLDLADDRGGWRTIELAWTPFGLTRERRMLVSFRDLTADERRQRRERREETQALVGRLGSNLSHELANSLTAVHGYSRMIDPSLLTPPDRAALESIQKEADAIGTTLDAFRRVTRPLEMHREHIQIRWAIDDAAKHVTAMMNVPAHVVTIRVSETLELDADRVLLEEAFSYVLTNAIEACRQAGVVAAIVVSGSAAADGSAVTIEIRDNGPGVPPEQRDKLLELFASTQAGHLGFGLARTRHIIESHDGAVGFEHPQGGGLVVTIELPMRNSASGAPERR